MGSLDLIEGKPQLDMWTSTGTQQVDNGRSDGENPPPMDLVIMNPPFTRDSLRHDQFSKDEERAIKQREKEMMEGQPYRRAARLSGSANAFLVLGDKLAKEESGVLAVVLPTVMATNAAASETRKHLAERFHVETIVSTHDPKRIFFSENTSIGEILLILRRWRDQGPKPPTNIVNLQENPRNALEALNTARMIQQAIHRGGQGPRRRLHLSEGGGSANT